jgi:hypothetical protein
LGPIKSEFFASAADDAFVQVFAKRDFRLSPFSVNRHHRMPFTPYLMLVLVEPTSLLGQPFAKCSTIHCPDLINSGAQEKSTPFD